MNPVFIVLVILASVLLWFLLSVVFFPLGKLLYGIWKDAVDEMNREEKESEDD